MKKNAPGDFVDNLRGFVFIPDFAKKISDLAALAESEDWDYKKTKSAQPNPVLYNYISYTYKRIAEEKKISISADGEFLCWNTGLITKSQEPIFFVAARNKLEDKRQFWHYFKLCRKGESDLNRFAALPEMAHYFEDPSELVFDSRMDLRVNVEHIVDDNIERFPLALQSMNKFGLQNIIKGAIDTARERVRRNYKIAIPQYYQGSIQLLLPLSLTDPLVADMALVVERCDNFYRSATCLTLDMAYNNARQLARPDRDWLVP